MLQFLLTFLSLLTLIHADFPSDREITRFLNTLSRTARNSALFPEDRGFKSSTERLAPYPVPRINLVLTPLDINDIERIVKFATRHDIPMLPVVSTHGAAVSLADFKDGILIHMRPHFTSITKISDEEIEVEGGVINGEVIEFLYQNKLRTSTGGCDCVGFFGPALGGGIAKNSGRTGMILDTLKSVDIVTPDTGGVLRVSNEIDKELFWGLRGAGHNMGISVRARVKVIPVDPKKDGNSWLSAVYDYSVDRTEEVITFLEKWRTEVQEDTTTLFLSLSGPNNPQLHMTIQDYGTRDRDDAILAPFDALKPTVSTRKVVAWNKISEDIGMDVKANACIKKPLNGYRGFYPATISHLSPKSIRETVNWAKDHLWPSGHGGNAQWMLFPQHAVRKVPLSETSYIWRNRGITATTTLSWNSSAFTEEANRIGEMGRKIINVDDTLNVYVNYALGTESLEAVYGSGKNLQRLLALKRKHDPQNLLSGYMPLIKRKK